ncbi:MAG: tRNA-dihydrouridine synthase family protein, partial [Acetatifactor sp.]|nr:tRNA-dihydrouridine synthase family protein [Acetatifactor sp.]
LRQMGYSHVNLNLGCPSGTVVSRGRGAGFLGYPRLLDSFLAEISEKCPLSISIKTRIGVADMENWEELLQIYRKYPVEELIIHPRIQRDFYNHPIRWEGVELALEHWKRTECGVPLCYNGEIHSLEEYQAFRQRFPQIRRVMLGRGILKNPFLTGQLRQWENGQQVMEADGNNMAPEKRRKVLGAFHQELLDGYREIMSGDQNTLFKMKELWTYFGESFPGTDKARKKIRKAGSMAQYEAAVREVFGAD